MRMTPRGRNAALLVAVALLALPAVPASAQPPMASVVVTPSERRALPNTMTLVGTVEPYRRSVIGSEIAGLTESMPVRQGDLVEKGALIVKLNDDSLRWQLAEAEANINAARARLTQTEFDVERMKRLYDGSQANEKEVYDTQAEHDVARFELEEKKAIADRLRTDLSKTAITAPFTGYVLERKTEIGEWVDRGGDVVELVDLSSVLVRVDVPESAIAHVMPQAPCTVYVDALKRSFDGRVGHIIRQADAEARTFPVEVVVANDDRSLAGGMFARVTVISGPPAEVVAVPKDAVVEKDGVRYVGLVIPGDHGTMGMLTPITTGADIGDWIAVTSGNLQAGQDVIIRGNERGVYPGFPSPVTVVDESGRPINPPAAGADNHGGHGS